MDDEKQILVFSDAGGTGRSYHADLNARNQRQRIHYLLEPGWKADTAIQGLGRTNRTNQKTPPVFRPVATDVKGERRFISTIARRLDSLGAITRGQRETGSQNMFRPEDNLESDYARTALRQLYYALYKGQIEGCGLLDFEDHTGLKLMAEGGAFMDDLPPINQFLNRMLALRIEMQNLLFDAFELRLRQQVEGAKESGTYDIGVETLIAESFNVIERTRIHTHEKSGATSQCLKIERKDKSQPLTLAAALEASHFHEGSFFAMNHRSNRVALIYPYTNAISEDGAVIERFRLMRPMTRFTLTKIELDKSNWKGIDLATFKRLWRAEIDAVPEFTLSSFYLVTGLLLPIWKALPDDHIRVNRLQTEDGERLIGRVIAADKLDSVYRALGLTDRVDLRPHEVWAAVIERGSKFRLSNGWKLLRSRVMGENRFELSGPIDTDLAVLKASGFMTEVINWQTRLFIPRSPSAVQTLQTLLDRTPVVASA